MRFFFPLTYFPEPELQSIEVASSFQIPSFQIVGLPGPEVNESRERVRAAIEASGLEFPRRRVVINLAPASVRKRGTGSDLAMALAVLAHRNLDEGDRRVAAWAELGLDGSTKPCPHPTRALYAAARSGVRWFLHAPSDAPPLEDASRWVAAEGLSPPERVPVASLAEAWSWVQHPFSLPAPEPHPDAPSETDDSSILPVPESLASHLGPALAGFHSLLLLGPRGTGKTLALEQATACFPAAAGTARLRQRLNQELLPEGDATAGPSTAVRVGPEIRPGGLLGGWSDSAFRPGALARAHEGLLLADELPEWSRDSRESLRGPLEQGSYVLHRRDGSVSVRSRFLLLGTGNLCPCGGIPPDLAPKDAASKTPCRCTRTAQDAYARRISGPVLDRIDWGVLLLSRREELKHELAPFRERIASCRDRLLLRWGALPGLMSAVRLEDTLRTEEGLRGALDREAHSSLRSRHKALRMALTLREWIRPEPDWEHCVWQAAACRPERILER